MGSDDYLRHLCRYIHANPVKAGFAMTPELWPYSNYLDRLGLRAGQLLDRGFVQTFFPDMQRYQASVLGYLTRKTALVPGIKAYLDSLWDCGSTIFREGWFLTPPGRA